MDLRTPAPLSDDEIYGFAEAAQPVVSGSAPAARSTSLGIDVSVAPASAPKTMISDPVIVCLDGSTRPVAGSAAATEVATANTAPEAGEPKPATSPDSSPSPAAGPSHAR